MLAISVEQFTWKGARSIIKFVATFYDWSWYFVPSLSDADDELVLIQRRLQTPRLRSDQKTCPKAVGFAVVCSLFALCVSSAVEQHDLVHISCWQAAVQVSWHLHRCVVDSSVCLHNCACCTWSLSWRPQTLHEYTSQDLWGELGVYLMHNITRRLQNQRVICINMCLNQKFGELKMLDYLLIILCTTFGNKYLTPKRLNILWHISKFCTT